MEDNCIPNVIFLKGKEVQEAQELYNLSLSANAIDQISDEMDSLCCTCGKHRKDMRIQLNFLRQTAASRCAGFLTFQELTTSPSSGCARDFCYQTTSTP
jgi:hypothetical protein